VIFGFLLVIFGFLFVTFVFLFATFRLFFVTFGFSFVTFGFFLVTIGFLNVTFGFLFATNIEHLKTFCLTKICSEQASDRATCPFLVVPWSRLRQVASDCKNNGGRLCAPERGAPSASSFQPKTFKSPTNRVAAPNQIPMNHCT